jgi:hypothetical protein
MCHHSCLYAIDVNPVTLVQQSITHPFIIEVIPAQAISRVQHSPNEMNSLNSKTYQSWIENSAAKASQRKEISTCALQFDASGSINQVTVAKLKTK